MEVNGAEGRGAVTSLNALLYIMSDLSFGHSVSVHCREISSLLRDEHRLASTMIDCSQYCTKRQIANSLFSLLVHLPTSFLESVDIFVL